MPTPMSVALPTKGTYLLEAIRCAHGHMHKCVLGGGMYRHVHITSVETAANEQVPPVAISSVPRSNRSTARGLYQGAVRCSLPYTVYSLDLISDRSMMRSLIECEKKNTNHAFLGGCVPFEYGRV